MKNPRPSSAHRRERVITDGEKSCLQQTVLVDAILDLVDFEGADCAGLASSACL